MRVSAKGQVTIPVEIRKKLNITPGMEVDFYINQDDRVVIIKKSQRFSQLQRVANVKMTTEEIMALTRGEN